jgi:hypothetical protein
MQVTIPTWLETAKKHTRYHFSDLDSKSALVVFVLFIPFVLDWLIGSILIAIIYFLKESMISIFQSGKTIKASGFTLLLGYLFVYPNVGKIINLASFYSNITISPATGPDPLACLEEYNIDPYATDIAHDQKIRNILNKMDFMDSPERIDQYIKSVRPNSPVTGYMVWKASKEYSVDARLMLALMENDSHFGTEGLAKSTRNPGNVGNDDEGHKQYNTSWQEGVNLVAKWLKKHRKLFRHADVV